MPRLIFQLPSGEERREELPAGEAITLGRADDNVFRLPEPSVSRHHARLTCREDGTWLIEDLGSSYGTYLNEAAINRPEALQDGDRLRLAGATALYLADDAEAETLTIGQIALGEVFAGRYRLDAALGDTAEYEAFLAADLPQGVYNALKIFHPGVIAAAGGFERVSGAFRRIRQAPVHANLCQFTEFARWRGRDWLTAEWIEGHPLLDLVRRRGALAAGDAVYLAGQAAAATDHARAHALPAPDLDLRAVLISFESPLAAAAEWETLLGEPLANWPAFTLKISPRLFGAAAPAAGKPYPLGALLQELLGRPPSSLDASARAPRIASLGENGNAILARGLASAGADFGGDSEFVAALAQAI